MSGEPEITQQSSPATDLYPASRRVLSPAIRLVIALLRELADSPVASTRRAGDPRYPSIHSLLLAALPASPAGWGIAWPIALCGIGFGFFQTPNNTIPMHKNVRSREMDKSRRWLIGAGLSGAASLALAGTKHVEPISMAGAVGAIDLWPTGRIPGGSGPGGPERLDSKGAVTNVSRPRLNVYPPKRPNGTAVLVVAGGGYTHIELGTESTPACLWLQSLGIVAFELVYRLPRDGWSPIAPLQDGQRAMRILRSSASSYGVDPDRIGLIGFSAGGHLSGMTAVSGATERYPKVDESDGTSSTPNFAGLIYPVLSLMPPFDKTETRRQLVGRHPDLEQSEALSVDRHVSQIACPIFLAQAKDDPVSPIDNSLLMFNALRNNNIPSELHVFQAGGHGWGMGQPGTLVHAWPTLFISWLRFNNLVATDA